MATGAGAAEAASRPFGALVLFPNMWPSLLLQIANEWSEQIETTSQGGLNATAVRTRSISLGSTATTSNAGRPYRV